MFDIGRTVALVWALLVMCRARAWGAGLVVLAVVYVFSLEVASGITVREHGPFVPLVSMLLIFIGPSGMPRGPLPALPLAGAVVSWPAAVDGLAGAALAVLALRAAALAAALPWRDGDRIERLRRASLALTMNALFQVVVLAVRILPWLLDADLGDGRMG